MLSSTGEMKATHPLPTLSKVVALSMTYRLILAMWISLATITAAAPFISKSIYMILDGPTEHHSLLALLLTAIGTVAVRNSIRRAAPNEEKAKEAIGKTSFGLPLLMFIASTFMIRVVISPFEGKAGLTNQLRWSPTITFSVALRLAIGMLILGIGVILRFIGPPSVVRCSTSPLMAYPFTTALQTALSKLSADAILDFIAGPSDSPGVVIKTPMDYKGNARRMQGPNTTSIISQILIAAIVGVCVAYSTVLPLTALNSDIESSSYKASLIVVCIGAAVINLFQTTLDGNSHELNPTRYHSNKLRNRRNMMLKIRKIFQSLFTSSVTAPIVAFIASIFGSNDIDDNENQIWSMFGVCALIATIITLYLSIFDEALRTLLCSPPYTMKPIVEEVADDDRMEVFLDVVMHSLLHSDSTLVRTLSESSKLGLMDLEQKELERNEVAIKAMANVLLHKTSADDMGAHLEEDTLRLAILSSLGGTSRTGESFAGLDKADPIHVANIQQWVEPGDNVNINGPRSTAWAVPLVRALCAYTGGLGESLFICSGLKTSSPINPWTLPPGAVVCGEYAIRAASRCILWNFLKSSRTLADWRSTHLSMLVPVLLSSACRLEAGVVKFAQSRFWGKQNDHLSKMDLIKAECPEFFPLYNACNEAAFTILETLKSLEGVRQIEFDLDPDCQRWTQDILARIPNTTGMGGVFS